MEPTATLSQKIGIVTKNPNDLTPFFNNPRMNDDAVAGLKQSITEFGFLVPIVVDKDGIIVTGHTRHKAAIQLGLTEVPVIYATHLNDAQIKAFRIADNRLSENAKWDESKLSDELRSIQDMGFDLSFTGFSTSELDCLCGQINADCLKDLDYESVCGAVVEKQIQAKGSLICSVGNYKFYVSVDGYKVWEARLLKEFPKRADLVEELARRLGFDASATTAVGEKPKFQNTADPQAEGHMLDQPGEVQSIAAGEVGNAAEVLGIQ